MRAAGRATSTIASQTDYDVRNRIAVTSLDGTINPGACSYTIELHPYVVPAAGLTIWEAWVMHSQGEP